ncbi:MAG: two pore domain potassium channel family protein [Sphingomonas sp.]|nr:two pore domain potassium channel family protein [Sphingomonas sp.]
MNRTEAHELIEKRETLEQLDEWLDVPMLLLSVVWLGLVLYELAYGGSSLIEYIGIAIWIIFIAEFVLRFALAPHKRQFLKANWLTVIALLVPALRMLRMLRMFRLFRAARALRGARLVRIVGTANRSIGALKSALKRRQFGYVLAMTGLVLALGAGGMLSFEPASEYEDGFNSYGDALWWTAMMLTTIGSQYWPASGEGRILALLISVYGLAVFGYITASFASFFVGWDAEGATDKAPTADQMAALSNEIAALRRDLMKMQR